MNIEKITSRDNPKLKHARAVRDGKIRESIFIEGARLSAEAVSSKLRIETVFATHRFIESGSLSQISDAPGIVFAMSEQIMESLADTKSPQGIIIIAKRPEFEFGLVEAIGTSIFLYQINNPSNLGAVIRTAEAAGVRQILLSARSADPFSPKALRSAMGSAFRTKISEGCVLETVIDRSKKNGIEVLAVDAKGNSIYGSGGTPKPQMFVFGSEAHGLPDEIL